MKWSYDDEVPERNKTTEWINSYCLLGWPLCVFYICVIYSVFIMSRVITRANSL